MRVELKVVIIHNEEENSRETGSQMSFWDVLIMYIYICVRPIQGPGSSVTGPAKLRKKLKEIIEKNEVLGP